MLFAIFIAYILLLKYRLKTIMLGLRNFKSITICNSSYVLQECTLFNVIWTCVIHAMLVSYCNCKQVGNDHLGVPGNQPEVTIGGELIRDLVESGNWVMVNAMEEKVEGGPFTRQDPASGRQSCLDLWLCTNGLVPHVKSLVIDCERKMTVARPVWRRGRRQLTHYTMILTLKNLPTIRQAERGWM